MPNTVKITTEPIVLTDRQRKQYNADLRMKMAITDLDIAKLSIQRKLEQYIPVNFDFDVNLSLSINTTSFKIKIDYSKIPPNKSRQLIKLYLQDEMEQFAKEWLKLSA